MPFPQMWHMRDKKDPNTFLIFTNQIEQRTNIALAQSAEKARETFINIFVGGMCFHFIKHHAPTTAFCLIKHLPENIINNPEMNFSP